MSNPEEINNRIADSDGADVPIEAPLAAETDPLVAPRINTAAVAVRSAFWTVVAGMLLFACFLSFFPYTAMRFYHALDLREMALYSAERYLSRHADEMDAARGKFPAANGKYADALYFAVNTAADLMNESVGAGKYRSEEAQYYARKAEKYAAAYLDANIIGSLYERTERTDTYNLLHSSASLHPYVYSFADTLETVRFKAWYILGEYNKMQERVSTATTLWGQTDWTPVEADFLLLKQLSVYIDAELDELGLSDVIAQKTAGYLMNDKDIPDDITLYGLRKPFDLFIYDAADVDPYGRPYGDGAYTVLYEQITKNYDQWVSLIRENATRYALHGEAQDAKMHLKFTYYLKTLSEFTRSMRNMTLLWDTQKTYFDEEYRSDLQTGRNTWYNKMSVHNVRVTKRNGAGEITGTDTGTYQIYEWYAWGMLDDYCKFYAAA